MRATCSDRPGRRGAIGYDVGGLPFTPQARSMPAFILTASAIDSGVSSTDHERFFAAMQKLSATTLTG